MSCQVDNFFKHELERDLLMEMITDLNDDPIDTIFSEEQDAIDNQPSLFSDPL